ncbi:equilibrative nucleoside transporter 1 [Bufo bufo]|uniref:equilibrative nucleoside transporter 1 n=1 Tax=Bufo bufo TaxID=8384 RepID=UPI001ABECD48|nr:equilibrative nucleoside transporter 1 [Bufo bufo]XP_040286770.1 equilibrative nucleoside transporter 1 [Bufo bufo]XP_040286771.1 equilibrative nucleoside transporter 1 [Bufo bufo]
MTAPPKDRYNGVWLIFFMLGLGTLLPWNFFMTATLYFTTRLREDPSDGTARGAGNYSAPFNASSMLAAGGNHTKTSDLELPPTALQSKFNNVMTLCAMLPLLIFTCLNSILHRRISQNIRIAGSLVAIFLIFLLTAIFVKLPFSPVAFFTVTMVKIVFINSFGALLQGSLFGLAALFPASYTAPIMSGQGLAGTFAALAMICALASGSEPKDSSFGYFITACVVILLALLSYMALHKLEFYKFYTVTSGAINSAADNVELKKDLLQQGELGTARTSEKQSFVSILKKIWVLALSVCLVFTVTIGIFPSVTADVKSTIAGDSKWNDYFIPVSCFLLFNLFDWAGRSLTSLVMWPGKDSKLLPLLVAARLVFLPLFMLCNVMPRNYLPVYLAHDAWYICIMMLFAISNGYLASLCMCFGPKKVNVHEAETAGAIMAFFLSLGLALGAGFSFLLRSVV